MTGLPTSKRPTSPSAAAPDLDPPDDSVRSAHRSRDGITRLGWVGAALVALLTLTAVFAGYLTPYGPMEIAAIPHQPPSAEHLLGTNDLGQDLLTRLLYGTRLSLLIGVLAGLFATVLGLGAGLSAGYYRGKAEALIMRVVDLTLALPFIPLVIVLATFFGRGLLTTVVVIGAVLWARPGRVFRSQVLKIAAYQHVDAARAMGSTSRRTMLHHVLPRLAPLIAAQFVNAATVAVLIEASLAFLGLGDANRVSWGTMLFFANSSNAILTDAWKWWILPPGLTLTAAVVGFAFMGIAIEQWGDRRLSGPAGAGAPERWLRPGRRLRPDVDASSTLATAADADDPAVLRVRDLHVAYPTTTGPLIAVHDVSFSIRSSEMVGLVGESGCGKSTLAMSLIGLVPDPGRVTHGTIQVGNTDLVGCSSKELTGVRGRQVALIPQSSMNALNPAYTIHRQLTEAAALTRSDDDAASRAEELLNLVGLGDVHPKSFPHQLSGGMRQRVVIAMAVANDPHLLIADEPLTGLDVVTQETIVALLRNLQTQLGVAVLLVSHDLPLVASVADRVLVMYAGQIIESGAATGLLRAPAHPYTKELIRAFPRLHGPQGRLPTLAGQPPDLRSPPSGCRFHPRCPVVLDECAGSEPALLEHSPGRHAACLRLP